MVTSGAFSSQPSGQGPVLAHAHAQLQEMPQPGSRERAAYGGDAGREAADRREQGYIEVGEDAKYVSHKKYQIY